MSDQDFERRLERMFAQPPRMPDADAFAARVDARMERGWGVRRLLVGAAGILGGVITGTQLLNAELLRRLEAVSIPLDSLPQWRVPDSWTSVGFEGAALNGEVLWMTGAMLGLAFAFAATRWAEGS